jgi:hypothetical protein
MFDTKVVNSQTVILDTSANPVGTNTDAAHAQWSAASALFNNRSWTARNLYTRLPGPDPANPPGALQAFSDVDTLPSPNASAYTNLKPYVALKQTTDATKRSVIQFAMGGDTGGTFTTGTPPRPTTNRGTIMGDIVDSTPTSVEYNINDWAAQIAANPVLSTLGNPSHFRLILVGTNQGWLHAFGEVTTVVQTTDSSGAVQQQVLGKVDELWSFMPTDLLANLDYITVTNNPHRFMVDGPPTIYFLDLPPATGGQGNGVVDQLSTYGTPERALVIFGLGKGGRSYYALNIQNPFLPKLQWSLVPDEMAEAATAKGVTPVQYPFPHTITGGPSAKTVTDIMMNWGYSTCTPSIGRVMFNGVLHDAVFFGGGFSTSAVEANYNNVPLGRSVLAVDAWTGQALAAVDLTAASISGNPATIGPIASSLVPFEFFLGSGLAQRAYFQDFFGGLWAWGSKKTDTSTSTSGYRIDSSDITLWTSDGSISGKPGIRKVYQDSNGRNVYSSTPAPFRVGSFPGKGKSTSLAVPSAVGIAMESGNRNNPLDYYYTTSTKPANYRVTVAFDRQDSQNWGLDTPGGPDTGITDLSLLNVTGYTRSDSTSAPDAVTPGKSSYYLAPASGTPYFGYFLNFPGLTNNFFPKGINAPSVVSGSLFYSYFTPTTADPCTGGSGNTYSNFICDVYNPVQVDSRSNLACASGQDTIWSGVASNYVASGTTGTIQGGMLAPSAADAAKGVLPSLALVTVLGKSEQRHPKPRVWRTVQ